MEQLVGHILRIDESSAKQALQLTLQGHRGRGRPEGTWKSDQEIETWRAVSHTAGGRCRAAQDRAG